MKFKIKEKRWVIKTNIEGKVLKEVSDYYVYRSVFFGLVKLYVALRPSKYWEERQETGVKYTKIGPASVFTKEEAEELIKAFKEQPDRFVRYNY